MRQFKTWVNKQETESEKLVEKELMISRIEYRGTDRYEKSIKVQAFENKQVVTKDFFARKEIKPFGIG